MCYELHVEIDGGIYRCCCCRIGNWQISLGSIGVFILGLAMVCVCVCVCVCVWVRERESFDNRSKHFCLFLISQILFFFFFSSLPLPPANTLSLTLIFLCKVFFFSSSHFFTPPPQSLLSLFHFHWDFSFPLIYHHTLCISFLFNSFYHLGAITWSSPACLYLKIFHLVQNWIWCHCIIIFKIFFYGKINTLIFCLYFIAILVSLLYITLVSLSSWIKFLLTSSDLSLNKIKKRMPVSNDKEKKLLIVNIKFKS